MEAKNIDLTKTGNAIADLNEALLKLDTVISAKKDELAQRTQDKDNVLKEREKSLEVLKNSSEQIINQIDGVINKLDKVLENDGSSNNND